MRKKIGPLTCFSCKIDIKTAVHVGNLTSRNWEYPPRGHFSVSVASPGLNKRVPLGYFHPIVPGFSQSPTTRINPVPAHDRRSQRNTHLPGSWRNVSEAWYTLFEPHSASHGRTLSGGTVQNNKSGDVQKQVRWVVVQWGVLEIVACWWLSARLQYLHC